MNREFKKKKKELKYPDIHYSIILLLLEWQLWNQTH